MGSISPPFPTVAQLDAAGLGSDVEIAAAVSALPTGDLVSGNDQTFDATIGAWTKTGAATLTRDATYKVQGGTASLKWTMAASGNHVDLPVSGTFKAGKDYWFVVWLSSEATSSAYNFDLAFGLIGTDAMTYASLAWNMGVEYPFCGDGEFIAIAIHWRPTADRTGVSFRMTGNLTAHPAWHIGHARCFASPTLGPIFVNDRSYFPVSTANLRTLLEPWAAENGIIADGYNGSSWIGNAKGTAGFQAIGGPFPSTYLFAEHAAADLSGEGHNIEVGADYVGLNVSEKDAGTIQFYADVPGGYDVELVDRGAGVWMVRNEADTLRSPLNRLHHVLKGTVDPSAGGGVAHPQPAMYLRDNAGVTELWLATGAGATAWAKQTSP